MTAPTFVTFYRDARLRSLIASVRGFVIAPTALLPGLGMGGPMPVCAKDAAGVLV